MQRNHFDGVLDAIDRGAPVVTANRRLARALEIDYADRQIAAGRSAWASPPIAHYTRWLLALLADAPPPHARLHVGTHASRILWEACLLRELGERPADIGGFVRSIQDAWRQARAFDISPGELEEAAENRDQGVFARSAKRYAAGLEERGWIDDAGLEHHVRTLIAGGHVQAPERIVMTGFDRVTPALRALCTSLEARDVRIEWPEPARGEPIPAGAYRDREAELRAAGAWAREALQRKPDGTVGIVVTELEQDPGRAGRLVREGFLPGWQTGAPDREVNVSLGMGLDGYPLIAIALLVMRWLFGPLTSRQLGVLLRSTTVGVGSSDARSRLELRLRRIPARDWTPARVQRALERYCGEADTTDFISRVQALGEIAAETGGRAPPAVWAERVDRALHRMGWPGRAPLGTAEQQLVNRWRKLLNEFAALEPFAGELTAGAAERRLREMARDTVFQPQDTGARVTVLGPLEAAGMRFDALRVTGLDASRWPPPRRPSALIGRDLRQTAGLPDATPEDALQFAERVLERLAGGGTVVTGSYATVDGDRGQTLTTLAPVVSADAVLDDPGWHAERCRDLVSLEAAADPVPALRRGEIVRGGAAIIDRQIAEPFTAFARSRLGIDLLEPFAEGLTPAMRGTLIHDALRNLYRECPSQAAIRAWNGGVREQRIERAVREATARHRVAAGQTLERLLDFEEARVRRLLALVVELDTSRTPFSIDSVEGEVDARIGGLPLSLRHDRIDVAEDGSRVVLDYKTGTEKKLLRKGEPASYQLVVYAMGIRAEQGEDVGALGLYNVDSLKVGIDGYGRALNEADDMAERLAEWTATVRHAARAFVEGDVQLNLVQGSRDARPLALLSRYEERTRDPG